MRFSVSIFALFLLFGIPGADAQEKDKGKEPDSPHQRILKEREEKEKPVRTSFWENLHLDTMWVPTQTGFPVLGLAGMHFTIVDIGRVELFGPPGVILLSRPSRDGGREVGPAFTWGISIRLFEFDFPGTEKNAVLFANLVKCWTFGGVYNGFDLGGMSITWKKGS